MFFNKKKETKKTKQPQDFLNFSESTVATDSKVKTKESQLGYYRSFQTEVRDAKNYYEGLAIELKDFEKKLMSSFSILDVIVKGPFTIVEVAFEGYKAVGQSRKSEYDNPNEDLGYQIALGRAQRCLLSKINKDNLSSREVFAG